MSSDVDIVNRALQRIGSRRIGSLESDESREAKEARAMYYQVRDAELRMNVWKFSISRISIAASTTTPVSGRTYQYPLPADFVRTAPQNPKYSSSALDWLFEGEYILTEEAGPLILRYVSKEKAAERYDALFVEALSARLAMELGPVLKETGIGKQNQLENSYKYHISQARRLNAIELGPTQPNIDTWELVRLGRGV